MQATPSGRNYYPRPPSVHVPHTPIQLTTPAAKMETAIADVKRSQLLRKNFGAPAGLPSARVRSLSPARRGTLSTSTALSRATPSWARSRNTPSTQAGGRAPSQAVRSAFAHFDRNRSGYLDYRELRSALTHMGLDISTAATVDLLRAYDDYPDGKLDVFEFDTLVRDLNRVLGRGPGGGAMGTMSGPRPSASVRAAFARFDRNRSGFLDYRELRNALTHMGLDLSTSTAVELVRAYDDYPDGKLDIFEFSNLVRDLGAVPPPLASEPAWGWQDVARLWQLLDMDLDDGVTMDEVHAVWKEGDGVGP